MFRRFAVTDKRNGGDISRYEVVTHADGQAVIHTPDQSFPLESPSLLPSLAHGLILRHTLAQVSSHVLFHAASLSYQEKGIILAADSGCGKTTLALALVRQGFQFLSDEVAALAFPAGELAPYPRCLWVRAGTYQLFEQLGWEMPTHSTAAEISNRAAIHLSAELLGATCRPEHLILLQRPDAGDERICKVTLNSLPQRLLRSLEEIGIQPEILPDATDKFPCFRVKEKHITKIHETCEGHGVFLLNVDETAVDSDYYINTPILQIISKLTAALALLRNFVGSYRSEFIQQHCQGTAVGVIEPLVKILAPVQCYQLTPGRLDHSVEIIHALCQPEKKRCAQYTGR
mgnify:CR=1 FL=1